MDRAYSMILMTLLVIPMFLFMPQIASTAANTLTSLVSDEPHKSVEQNNEKEQEKQLINNNEE